MPPKSKNSQQNANKEISPNYINIQPKELDQDICKILQKSDLSPQNAKLFQSMCDYFEMKLTKKDEILRETLNEVKKMKTEIEKIEKMNRKINVLEETVEILKSKIDSNEQYERLDTMILSGGIPDVRPDENCIEVVQNVLLERNLQINRSDISIAHRTGKKPPPGSIDRRNIIFKLTRRDLKKDIKFACKQGDSRVYVNESLTPTRSTICYALRKMKKDHRDPIGGINTIDGNVYVWMPLDDEASHRDGNKKYRRITVNTKAQLDSFLLKYFKCDSSKYITDWQ